jgi:hypothetical protein
MTDERALTEEDVSNMLGDGSWETVDGPAWQTFRDLKAENERLRKLVQDLLDNDPNEAISDAGHTVLDLWRHDARKMLSRHSGADVVRRGMGEK